jgi:hypothetical protein
MKFIKTPLLWIWRALKWAYSDSWRYILWMISLALFLVFLMTLIAYPVETILFVVVGTFAVLSLNFFTEVGRGR